MRQPVRNDPEGGVTTGNVDFSVEVEVSDEDAVGSGQDLLGKAFGFVFRKGDLELAVGVVETGLNTVCDLAGEWSGKVPEKTREQATPTDGPPAQVLPIPCVERV